MEEFKSDFSLICFFAESQIFFVPMMPLLKIRDVSGLARFLVSANSLNELKAKGKHHLQITHLVLNQVFEFHTQLKS